MKSEPSRIWGDVTIALALQVLRWAPSESQFRFVLRQPTDPARELLMATLAFDVPQAGSE